MSLGEVGQQLDAVCQGVKGFSRESISSINQLSRCLISVSTDSKAHHPIRKA